MIVYRVYNENGGYVEYTEEPQGVEFVIIDKTPEPTPIEVPQVISRRQFKLALAFLGYNENDILNGIDQLPEPNKTFARISYIESGTFERFSDDLIYVGKNFLNMTDEQIDEVFIRGNNF
jgi:hypothetical protein